MRRRRSLLALLLIAVTAAAFAPAPAEAAIQRFKFTSGTNYLIVEVLDDDLAHFELSALGPGPAVTSPIFITPQVAKTNYAGPSNFTQSGSTIETPELRIAVNTSTLCVTSTDKIRNFVLHTLCPINLAQAWKGFTLTPETLQHVYGLGAQWKDPVGASDGDWTGRVRTPGNDFGNAQTGWNNGAIANVQIPVMYALGPSGRSYGLFLDQIQKSQWDFTVNPWRAEMWGDQIRWYVLTGPDIRDIRSDYMDLTGRPPVPPKKMFGMWVSEWGFESWAEIDGKLATLRANKFPIDGFVMDVQWFGGMQEHSETSGLGRLSWDTAFFPNAAAKLATYKNTEGIGIMTVEESYIARGQSAHPDLAGRGYLVRAGCSTCGPVFLDQWWGAGGMIDWTLPAAGDYWHDLKRQALINDGVMGHWTDLGEPETFDFADWVNGVIPGKHGHADYHNIYNLKWLESIVRGYARNGVTRRPFMMSRSGAAGLQRFGAAMWSGDVGSRLPNLANHMNVQMHMSMSGIDYYGSDLGGFFRSAVDTNETELYTQWFANGMAFDVPGRPHAENLCNCHDTSPAVTGNIASNLANVRRRYELVPYTYSLAHRANRFGEPVVPPLFFYYPNDTNLREMGHEKLVGRDLLVAIVAGAGETQRGVYLPAGDWVDFHTGQWIHSTGQTIPNVPEYANGLFRLPMYARAGAIFPKMFVDDKTMNVLGKRTDGTTRNELIVRAYAWPTATSFTLYEDDGETTAYQGGAVRTTLLSQQRSGSTATVTIAAAAGTYTGAPSSRVNVVELVQENVVPTGVTLGGAALLRYATRADFDAAASGWYNAGAGLVLAKSASLSVTAAKTFVFSGTSTPTAITSGSAYVLTNQNSAKCVDATGAATANGTLVQQYACNTSTAQQWVFTATDSGYYRIATKNAAGQVWDVKDVLTTDSAAIHLWAVAPATNQQWQPVVVAGPYYRFIARHSAKCLDVPFASTADVGLQQYTCNNGGAQQFSLQLVGATPTPTPTATATPTSTPRATPRATPTAPSGCAIGATCEAESALRGGGVVASTLHAGYTGSGFADYQGNGTGTVEWTVSVPSAGTYNLNIRYANGGTADRPMSIQVNGTTVVTSLSFPVTGWTTWTVRTQAVTLPAGSVRIRATELQNGPNVDNLVVTALQ